MLLALVRGIGAASSLSVSARTVGSATPAVASNSETIRAAAGTSVARVFDSGGPDPVFQGFVNQCLRDKGYQVAGGQ